jgi:hypothetical protein
MTTEFYILKIRITSALRWIKELGFIRIIGMLLIATAILKSFSDIKNSPAGIAGIILLNASVIYSVHFSRKDEFFLSSLDINKKLLFALEYFLYSVPFLILIILSDYYYFCIYIIFLLGFIINIKSGNKLKITFTSEKSLFPSYAFEWISGIRANFFLFLIIYLLGLIFSYQLAGGVIAIFALTLMFSSFYIENEPLIFIEAYKTPVKKFLLTKIIQSCKMFFLTVLPIALLHIVFFYDRWYLISGLISICLIIISSSVLTKYAFYSEDISSSKMNHIINGVIIFSFVSAFFMTGPFLFPLPFLMIIYLYKKASQNLKNVRYIAY